MKKIFLTREKTPAASANEYLEKDEKIVDVPLLGKVTAGNPIEAIEMPDEYFSYRIEWK